MITLSSEKFLYQLQTFVLAMPVQCLRYEGGTEEEGNYRLFFKIFP